MMPLSMSHCVGSVLPSMTTESPAGRLPVVVTDAVADVLPPWLPVTVKITSYVVPAESPDNVA